MSGSFEKHGNIGVIRINNPPVNAIGATVRAALVDGVNQLEVFFGRYVPQLIVAALACVIADRRLLVEFGVADQK
jgi:hypothetical protein